MFDEFKFLSHASTERENPLITAGIHPHLASEEPALCLAFAANLLRDRSLRTHPDRGGGPEEEAEFKEVSELSAVFRDEKAASEHMSTLRAANTSFHNKLRDLRADVQSIDFAEERLTAPVLETIGAVAFPREVSLWGPDQVYLTLLPIDIRSKITSNPSAGQLGALEKQAVRRELTYEDIPEEVRVSLREEVVREFTADPGHSKVIIAVDRRMELENPTLHKKYVGLDTGETKRMSKKDVRRYENRSGEVYEEEFARQYPEEKIQKLVLERYQVLQAIQMDRKNPSGPAIVDTFEFYIHTVAAAQAHAALGTASAGRLTIGERTVEIIGIVKCPSEKLPVNSQSSAPSGLTQWHDLPASALNRILPYLVCSVDEVLIDYDGWDEAASESHYLVTASRDGKKRTLIHIEGEIQAVHTELPKKSS